MKKQTIIIIIVAALIVISLIAVLFSLSKPTKKTVRTLDQFTISVIAKNQAADFYLIKDGSTTKIDPLTLVRYASYSFNSTKDILWLSCPTGYGMSSQISTTNNRIMADGTGSVGIEIFENKDNNITFKCTEL